MNSSFQVRYFFLRVRSLNVIFANSLHSPYGYMALTKDRLLSTGFLSCLSLMILAFGSLWYLQVKRSSLIHDEAGHIAAGVYHWKTGRMDSYRVNPPLPRMLATNPIWFDPPEMSLKDSYSQYDRGEFDMVSSWHQRSTISEIQRQTIRARMGNLIFVAIGLFAICSWARDLYGTEAALAASALWLLNPDIIANSAVMAGDFAASATGLLAGYRYWLWLRCDSRPIPWDVAFCVALAMLCKFSWLFLFVALPLITLIHDVLKLRQTDENLVTSNEPCGHRPEFKTGSILCKHVALGCS